MIGRNKTEYYFHHILACQDVALAKETYQQEYNNIAAYSPSNFVLAGENATFHCRIFMQQ